LATGEALWDGYGEEYLLLSNKWVFRRHLPRGVYAIGLLRKYTYLWAKFFLDGYIILPRHVYDVIIVKKLNSLKHLVRTTVAESHN